jgi:phosphoribosylformimino-5-aminoimidazole carboxamide ribonucleotide (ProFAR) isomerase
VGLRRSTTSRAGAIDGLGGVITGKALYEGRFTVAEALAVRRRDAGVLEGVG